MNVTVADLFGQELPPVTREGNEIHAGEWSWDLRDEPATLDDARAVLAAAIWFQEHTR